ncbi:hypothetical protein ACF0H5_016772 [Mactra antiquata]
MASEAVSIILVLMAIGQRCVCEIKPLQPLPKDLQSYFDICRQTGDLTHNTGKLVFWTSMQQYITKFFHSQHDLTPREAELLSRTVFEIMEPLIRNQTAIRYKRQATVRIRKEIRAMTISERRNYFNVLNAAKHDQRLSPNVYDALARIHTAENVGRGHFGPAFLSWHRLYLYIVESILREWYDPTVTIPFWASVLDNEMTDSSQSVIWSDGFFGNGNGVVNRGPLSNWPTITPNNTIKRNVGNGNLLSYSDVENILMRTKNSDILMPTALPSSNFELMYAGPLNYIGGNINDLQRAAFDPIFFSHHAFVDQIWERFRMGQINAGIDPETDYPYDASDNRFSSSHAPDAVTGFSTVGQGTLFGMRLAKLTQKVGFSNRFSDIIVYENVPHCPDCNHSPHLFCEKGRCMPRTISEMAGTPDIQDLGLRPFNKISSDDTMVMEKPPPPPPVHENEGCPRYIHIKDFNTDRLGSISRNKTLSKSDKWVYLPVKVISKRPSKMKGYDDYNLYDDQRTGGPNNDFLNECVQKGYDNCPGDQDPVGKINIVSYGLNYDGFAEDFIVVDNRLGVSEGNGFLPVKKPTDNYDSDVIIAAFDSCGRVCKPYCHLPECDRLNEEFNGGLSITTRFPQHYFLSHEEALLGVWTQSATHGPLYKNDIVPITFFCECTDTWIWDRYIPPPWKKSTDTRTLAQIPRGPIKNYHTVQKMEPVSTNILNILDNASDQSLISSYQVEGTHLQPSLSNLPQYPPERNYKKEPSTERSFYTNRPPPPRDIYRKEPPPVIKNVMHSLPERNVHSKETQTVVDYMTQTQTDSNVYSKETPSVGDYTRQTPAKRSIYKKETLPKSDYIRQTSAERSSYNKETPHINDYTKLTQPETRVYNKETPPINDYLRQTQVNRSVNKKETSPIYDNIRQTQGNGNVYKKETPVINDYITQKHANRGIYKKETPPISDYIRQTQAAKGVYQKGTPVINDYITQKHANRGIYKKETPPISDYIRQTQAAKGVYKKEPPPQSDYTRQSRAEKKIYRNEIPPASDLFKKENSQAINYIKKALSAMSHKKEAPSTRNSYKQEAPRTIDFIKKAISAMKIQNKYPSINGVQETTTAKNFYKKEYSNARNTYKKETLTEVNYKKNDSPNHCQVSTNCILDVPCRGCNDFDYKKCDQGRQIAICLYGKFSVTRSNSSREKRV